MPLFSTVLAYIVKKLVSISGIISVVVFGKPDMKINNSVEHEKSNIRFF